MKTRMETGRYMWNVYPFSKFRRFMPEKLPLFINFANSRMPLKNYAFLSKSGHERGIRCIRNFTLPRLCLNTKPALPWEIYLDTALAKLSIAGVAKFLDSSSQLSSFAGEACNRRCHTMNLTWLPYRATDQQTWHRLPQYMAPAYTWARVGPCSACEQLTGEYSCATKYV